MASVKNWLIDFKRGCTFVLGEPRPAALTTATKEVSVTKVHTLRFSRPLIERPRESWDSGHLKRVQKSYCTWRFVHLEAVNAMCSMCAHSGGQVHSWDHFRAVLHEVPAQSETVPMPFFDRQQNVDLLLHTRAQEELKHGTESGERAGKQSKPVLSAVSVMATVFWNSQGVIYIQCLESD